MKKPQPSLVTSAVTLLCAALVVAACSDSDRADAGSTLEKAARDAKSAATDVATDTGDVISDAWSEVRDYTFDRKSEFEKHADASSARMKARLSQLRADRAEAAASESRSAAMADLADSEADFERTLAELGTATADTWDAARSNVILAWDKLDAAYRKARAD